MPKKGRRRKKSRTHVEPTPDTDAPIPRSFVFRSGKIGPFVKSLMEDLRTMMQPNTAVRLKDSKKSTIKDYVHVAGQYGVTHFLIVSETTKSTNLRIARVPRGPTLSFKVIGYTLMRHVKAVQKRAFETTAAYRTSPLVVLNNFDSGDMHMKLMTATFQNMFPSISVATVKLCDCRRVVLMHYEKDTDTVELRHYAIRAMPTGMSRSVKQIVRTRVPDLSKLSDISDFILRNEGTVVSDSEAEDDASSTVSLSSNFSGRGNRKSAQSAIRLSELGPRLTLQLAKVEKELCQGDVLYHAFMNKTPQEIAKLKQVHAERKALKKKRREEQEENVEKKRKIADEKVARKKAKTESAQASWHGQDERWKDDGDEEEEEEEEEEF